MRNAVTTPLPSGHYGREHQAGPRALSSFLPLARIFHFREHDFLYHSSNNNFIHLSPKEACDMSAISPFLSSFKSLTSWLCSSTEWLTFLRIFLGTYLILEELIHLVLRTFPSFAMCKNTTNEHSLFKNVERAVLCWNQLGEKRRRWMHGNWCGSQISPVCSWLLRLSCFCLMCIL